MRKIMLGAMIVVAASGLLVTSNVLAAPVAASKDEVSALKAQVNDLQSKIIVLEKKLQDQSVPLASSVIAVPGTGSSGLAEDPFDMMDVVQQQINTMMGSSGFGGPAMMHQGVFSPDYDIKENDTAYMIAFDMPGMDKSKINVEVKEGVLLVSGERSSETKEGQGDKFYRQQRSFGYFSRMIPLPKNVDSNIVQAKYDNGVLTVTVGKKELSKKEPSRKVEIK